MFLQADQVHSRNQTKTGPLLIPSYLSLFVASVANNRVGGRSPSAWEGAGATLMLPVRFLQGGRGVSLLLQDLS
jgi:hypothetical protein